MQCEMCGKEVDGSLPSYSVEGVVMHCCSACSKYGTKIQEQAMPRTMSRSVRASSKMESQPDRLVSDYAQKIKASREKRGMSQKDFARFLNEKESVVHLLESGHIKPSERVLQKLKSKMGLHLLALVASDDDDFTLEKSSSSGLTIGDMIKEKL